MRYDFPGGKCGRTVSYARLQALSPDTICRFYRDFAAQVGGALGLELVPTQAGDKSSCSLLIYDKPGDFIDWHHDVNFYRGRHFTVLLPLVVEEGVDAQLQAVVPNGRSVHRLQARDQAREKAQAEAQALSQAQTQAQTQDSSAQPVVKIASASQALVAPWSDRGNSFPEARVAAVPTVEGRVVIFEGDYVFHRVTPMGAAAAGGAAVGAGVGGRMPRRVILSMTFTTDPTISLLSEATRRLKDISYFGPLAALLT